MSTVLIRYSASDLVLRVAADQEAQVVQPVADLILVADLPVGRTTEDRTDVHRALP
jgi:hypothetical protein